MTSTTFNPMRRRLGLGAAALSVCAPLAARAQNTWPTRPVTIVVPFAPGGNTDLIARMMAEVLSQRLEQPFIVDNRGGAGGTIAAEYVARSKPDGQTLFMSTMTQIVTAPMTNKIRYDPVKDFVPIINVGGNPFILAVNVRHGFKTLADLVNYGKANPGALNVGHGGTGGLTHLSALLFLTRTGVQATTVPYRGGAQALADVLAGQIDMYSASVSEVLPHAATGKVSLLAVSSERRLHQLPDLPTIAETYPGHAVETWNGLVGPAGIPAPILAILSRETDRILTDPTFRSRLEAMGITPYGELHDAFAARIQTERTLWKPVVDAAGITPQ